MPTLRLAGARRPAGEVDKLLEGSRWQRLVGERTCHSPPPHEVGEIGDGVLGNGELGAYERCPCLTRSSAMVHP